MYLDCGANATGRHWSVGLETASCVSSAGCASFRARGYTCFKPAPNDVGALYGCPLSHRTHPRHPSGTRSAPKRRLAVQNKRRDRLRPMATSAGCGDAGD